MHLVNGAWGISLCGPFSDLVYVFGLLVWMGIDCTVDPYADQDKDWGTWRSFHGRVLMNERVEEHELEEEL